MNTPELRKKILKSRFGIGVFVQALQDEFQAVGTTRGLNRVIRGAQEAGVEAGDIIAKAKKGKELGQKARELKEKPDSDS